MVIHLGRDARGSQRRRAAALPRQHGLAAHPGPTGGNPPAPDQPRTRQRPADVSSAVEFHPVDADPAHAVRRAPRPDKLAQVQAGCSTPSGCPTRPHEQMAAFLEAAVLDHARRHGWPKSTMLRTQQLDAGPAAHPRQPRCDAAGQRRHPAATDRPDRDPRHRRRHRRRRHARRPPARPSTPTFDTTTADLPAPHAGRAARLVRRHAQRLHHAPATHTRASHDTIRLYLRNAMPALTTWADQGHTSLREITPTDVRAVLPASGNPRSTMGAGLRSILTLLKARKILFVNPIARIQHRRPRAPRPRCPRTPRRSAKPCSPPTPPAPP